jgi:hypothetical protein
LIPLILGLACDKARPVATSNFILLPAPDPMPAIVDGSPFECPECVPVNGQKMWKITERDFVSFKRKLKEYDKEVREYLRPLLGEPYNQEGK